MVNIDTKAVPWRTTCRTCLVLISVLLLAGCTSVSAPSVLSQNIFILDPGIPITTSRVKRNLVLAVSLPQARPGFDTPQIAYLKQQHELNYFAYSKWAATPAHMLEPLLLQALEQSESFKSIVQTASAVPADVILETELIRLQHNFETRPSHVQLTLRAQLIDVRRKKVLAVKQFDESENAVSEDAYGGVAAANRALQRLLINITNFCISGAVDS